LKHSVFLASRDSTPFSLKLASPPSLPETLAEIHHEGASGRLASVKITVAVAGLW